MNANLVNAIAERMCACWAPLRPLEPFVLEDAEAAASVAADFVAALPASYTAADVLAAMRGEDAPAARVRQFSIDAAHIAHQREWSARTFGPGDRTAGVIDHIRKELDEIAAKPDDIEEWADLIILAFDGAWRADHDPQAILDAVAAKQAKNEARTWPDWRTAEPGKAIEHVREGEHPTDAAPDRGVGPVTAIVRYESARSLGIDANATIVCTDRWVVALGEYADEGEPEVLVHVGWAVDADGNDIRKSIARRIAAMLDDDALDGTS